MYIHSVKFINFKSIGDYPENEIIIEPKVTAIIGKNESGKSNILEGLSQIDFRKNNRQAFDINKVNRNAPTGTENTYIIILKPLETEIEKGVSKDTKVEINKNSCIVTGGFLEYCQNHNIMELFEKIILALNECGFPPFSMNDTELNNYRIYKSELEQKERLDLYYRTAALIFLSSRIGKIKSEYKDQVQDTLNELQNMWQEGLEMFPTFFYRKSDKHLKSVYKLEDIEKEVKNSGIAPNSLLYDFVTLLEVSSDDFILACKPGITAKQETLRDRIKRSVEKNINVPFREFYKTENIYMNLSFNNGAVSFTARSEEGETMLLSERSNGLKWYLETFIDAQAHNVADRNVIFLFDEPGISLHVNAQKELLRLFRQLADRGNQVVYTTHSPYMLDLDGNGICQIRAIVKDEEGFSHIYKTAYDSRISPESGRDILAPLVNAIGMNLQDTIGPAINKINIVVEGISDCIYLNTMAHVLGIDKTQYAFIPSIGASNCINICAILHGWGCKCFAIFDYDKGGVESGGEILRKDFLFEFQHQYCYLKDVSQDDVNQQTYKTQKYMIEDVVTRQELDKYCESTGTLRNMSKTLLAKKMSISIENGEYEPSEQCKRNFTELFKRIFSYIKSNN